MRSQYEETTLFDFIDVLTVLNRSEITGSDYISFGLFKDTDMLLPTLSNKDFRERFKLNHELFTKIDSIHKNGIIDTELERYFDDAGIELLLNSNWQDSEFNPVYASYRNKQNDKGLEYVEGKKKTQEEIIFWEKPAGRK